MTHPAPTLDPIELLLVEDREADVELTRQGLEEARFANTLHVVRDGVEAMAFLRREGPFADAPRPDLILLDLNLPRKDGRKLLAEIKGHEVFRMIPVVVLTTSQADRDVIEAYANHVNAYMTKPIDFNQFIEVVREITNYWLALVKLPPKPEGLSPAARPSNATSRRVDVTAGEGLT